MMRHEEAAAVASLLTVALYGFNDQRKVLFPATAVRVAPGLALTAKHVTAFMFQQLGLRDNEPWPRGRKIFEGMEIRAAEQELGGRADQATAPWWYVDSVVPSKVTDISVIVLTAGNEAARNAEARGRFLRWSLEPPTEQQRLWAYGYVEVERERELSHDEVKTNFDVTYARRSRRCGWSAFSKTGNVARRETYLSSSPIPQQ